MALARNIVVTLFFCSRCWLLLTPWPA